MRITHKTKGGAQEEARTACHLKCFFVLGLLAYSAAESAPVIKQGLATYYHANSAAACSLDDSVDYTMTTALGWGDYGNSSMCGAYLRVIGPKGEVVVRVVDACGACKPSDLDLNQAAFEKIADIKKGRESIRWHIISPALNTMVKYHFKPGSNAWWAGVQIRNHRNPVATLEYLKPDGTWGMIERAKYNYFVQKKPGMGLGPFTFRVTDIYGHSFVDKNIELMAGVTVAGKNQFPLFFENPIGVATDVQYVTGGGRSGAAEIRQPEPRRIASIEERVVPILKPKPTLVREDVPPPDVPHDEREMDRLVNSRVTTISRPLVKVNADIEERVVPTLKPRPAVVAPVRDDVPQPDLPRDEREMDQLVDSRATIVSRSLDKIKDEHAPHPSVKAKEESPPPSLDEIQERDEVVMDALVHSRSNHPQAPLDKVKEEVEPQE